MTAGRLRDLVAFEAAQDADDGGGSTRGGFAEVFRANAGIVFLRGSEPVVGQRLQGIQPVVITVRDCIAVTSVADDWRIRDVRSGATFNIRAITPNDRRSYVDFLCEAGRPDGDESNRP
ncbi:head-tail adaptor protein [Hansschlegelia beijingensis]|uniref:Head-tail adaptor n=1 Tax=Hansschlegelia beijingensis TaxID=1133344 RepID=A0A7W6D410_9HYPH|nr:head-tail adaptor protein [Hansschlegelia beijingensis]MBB3972778.1 head-tail adaptor [Hansschlegelia beijingensis]